MSYNAIGGNKAVVLHHPQIEATDATRAGVAFFYFA
jgi:hypothetical protein